jgi:hypothetical protein
MLAKELVNRLGSALIGRTVITRTYGIYSGGKARVVEIYPDPNAPEIVFNVQNDNWKDSNGDSIIGVFENEQVDLQ